MQVSCRGVQGPPRRYLGDIQTRPPVWGLSRCYKGGKLPQQATRYPRSGNPRERNVRFRHDDYRRFRRHLCHR